MGTLGSNREVRGIIPAIDFTQQGLQQGVRRQLIRVLQRRFGEIPQEVKARLEGESVEQLESLMDSAITVSSLEEFLTILSTC